MKKDLVTLLEDNPIIASIKDDNSLKETLKSDCNIVFVLYGTILNISEIIKKLKMANKIAFIDVDLIDGFSNKEVVIEYLKEHTDADGILSSKASMIKAANNYNYYSIHRFFLIDSFSFHNIKKQISNSKPDCIQILPGAMPKVISWVIDRINIPVIVGGLVCEKEDVVAALKAGAIAISSTNVDIWSI